MVNNSIVLNNCVDQLDWARGFPDIWLDSILGLSLRVSLDKISI